MGLEFIRAITAAYVQRRNSSKGLTNNPALLDRIGPDHSFELFRAQLRDKSTQIVPGYRALLKFESETKATVLQNGCVVADLDPATAEKLSKRLKANGKTSGMMDVLFQETPDISGAFQVKAAEPHDIEANEHRAKS